MSFAPKSSYSTSLVYYLLIFFCSFVEEASKTQQDIVYAVYVNCSILFEYTEAVPYIRPQHKSAPFRRALE